MWKHCSNLIARFRKGGPLGALRDALGRASESHHERRLGIRTSGLVECDQIGITNPECAHYYPSDYRSILKAFRHFEIRPGRDVFLDFGSGKGRVVIVAATFPFRRVIGVEISPELTAVARQNLDRARPKLVCQDVELVVADATSYRLPQEVNVVFFYNPFHGSILSGVLDSIRQSLLATPRKMTIVFKNTVHLNPHLPEYPWLVKRAEFSACDSVHRIAVLETR